VDVNGKDTTDFSTFLCAKNRLENKSSNLQGIHQNFYVEPSNEKRKITEPNQVNSLTMNNNGFTTVFFGTIFRGTHTLLDYCINSSPQGGFQQ
jgi:hypothetical protein